MVVALSSSGGVAMCYVVPVLLMTSCCPIVGPGDSSHVVTIAAAPFQRRAQADAFCLRPG